MPLGYTAPRDRLMLTAIRHKTLLVLGIALLAVVMGACGGEASETDIEATVEARVELAKVSLVAPTAAPMPTYTPPPTYISAPAFRSSSQRVAGRRWGTMGIVIHTRRQ